MKETSFSGLFTPVHSVLCHSDLISLGMFAFFVLPGCKDPRGILFHSAPHPVVAVNRRKLFTTEHFALIWDNFF